MSPQRTGIAHGCCEAIKRAFVSQSFINRLGTVEEGNSPRPDDVLKNTPCISYTDARQAVGQIVVGFSGSTLRPFGRSVGPYADYRAQTKHVQSFKKSHDSRMRRNHVTPHDAPDVRTFEPSLLRCVPGCRYAVGQHSTAGRGGWRIIFLKLDINTNCIFHGGSASAATAVGRKKGRYGYVQL